MIEEKLRKKIAELFAHYVISINVDGRYSEKPYVEEVFAYFKEAGYKLPSIKVCGGCPDRFEGCVRLADDQSKPVIHETGNYLKDLAALHKEYEEVEGHHIREDSRYPEQGCDHDYEPTFQGGDTYQCGKCGKEIDMTEDEDD